MADRDAALRTDYPQRQITPEARRYVPRPEATPPADSVRLRYVLVCQSEDDPAAGGPILGSGDTAQEAVNSLTNVEDTVRIWGPLTLWVQETVVNYLDPTEVEFNALPI